MARPQQNEARGQIEARVNRSGDMARIDVPGVWHKASDGRPRRNFNGFKKRIDLLCEQSAVGGIEAAGDGRRTNHARTSVIQTGFERLPRTSNATFDPARDVTTTLSPCW